jgi:hypothetical protein
MAIRIQLRHIRGGRNTPHTVVVSRPSNLGNLYRVGIEARDNAEAVAFFERDLEEARRRDITPEMLEVWRTNHRLGADGPFWIIENVHRWSGWNMACWCPLGRPCHGDVLLRMANQAIP